MSALGPHADFIITAYAVAVLIIAGLIAWVALDYSTQRALLNDLDKAGAKRRSQSP
jgi:heme exporter protein D